MNCVVCSGTGMFLSVKCVSCDGSGKVTDHAGMPELKEVDDGGGLGHDIDGGSYDDVVI